MQQEFITAWKTRANQKNLTASDMFDRCIIKAIRAKSNDKIGVAYALLKKAFSPLTNPTKLANGGCRWHFVTEAYMAQFSKPTSRWTLEHLTEEEHRAYVELSKGIYTDAIGDKIPETEYSFFFVRQDIFPEYQLVQNSHVALKLGFELAKAGVKDVEELHFVCIGVEDVEALEKASKLIRKTTGRDAVRFIEPDIGDELTTVASFPVKANKKHAFSEYKLLKFKKD